MEKADKSSSFDARLNTVLPLLVTLSKFTRHCPLAVSSHSKETGICPPHLARLFFVTRKALHQQGTVVGLINTLPSPTLFLTVSLCCPTAPRASEDPEKPDQHPKGHTETRQVSPQGPGQVPSLEQGQPAPQETRGAIVPAPEPDGPASGQALYPID